MTTPHIVVNDLTMAYGEFLIQRDLNFTINRGDVFIVSLTALFGQQIEGGQKVVGEPLGLQVS